MRKNASSSPQRTELAMVESSSAYMASTVQASTVGRSGWWEGEWPVKLTESAKRVRTCEPCGDWRHGPVVQCSAHKARREFYI